MATNYGVTSTGYVRKRLAEILEDMTSRFEDKLGVTVDRTSTSAIYQMFGVIAYELADAHTAMQDTYNAMYPQSASGVSLTNAAALVAIKPIAAEQTTLICTCTGDDGTEITSGSQVQDTNSRTYTNASDGYIQKSAASAITLTLSSVTVGTTYSITIDGTAKSYTAVSGDTASTVLTNIQSQFSFTDRTFTLTNSNLTISMTTRSSTMSVSASNLTISSVSSPITFTCDTYGDIDPGTGDITTIITAVTGWDSVLNEVDATTGRDDETDTELRQRWSQSVYKKASAMIEAIQANVYENVDGVTACAVYENTSDETDSDGRPPHSIEVVVEGGTDSEIASEIFTHKSAGIDTYGSVLESVQDTQGISHNISFNRPTTVKVWLKAVITKNSEDTWADDTLNTIKELLLTAGEDYLVGEDVILQRFLGNIYSNTTGVGYIALTAATGDTAGTYSSDNITITPRQVATFEASRIEVSLSE
ncbi:baseplate J/gp47 family protein [Pectinatus frisingensis]|uniref:baseplate J/gp47 family protein n=1 Tax=Pectinatus frisingensis TaxID=865 RepID=UPI0018C6502E|nr:baseplate J/gp47 family protein [Pectinatus frisingensis]